MKHIFSRILLVCLLFLLFFRCDEYDSTNKDIIGIEDKHISNPHPNSSATTASYSLINWMSGIDDRLTIGQLSIPGTHNSGARYESFGGTAKCQNQTISDQLNTGIRFLDIRCRHINNAFVIHHGSVYQNLNFNDVLSACYTFLNNNSSEVIIMSVKEEYTASNNTRSFQETFDSYVQQNPSKWYLGETVPALGSVRGKIVLFRRFGSSSPNGINASVWPDNAVFEINNASIQLKVQDKYQVKDNNEKWLDIYALLTEAKNGGASRLYINFTSGVKSGLFGIPNIPTASNFINPKITTYFNDVGKYRFGILAMDFSDASRNNLIVKSNF